MIQKYLPLLLCIGILACGGKSKEEGVQNQIESAPVTVTFFTGEVKILHSGEEVSPSQGMNLTKDDEIVTGEKGRLEVLVRNSGLIKISNSSSVSVSSLIRDGDATDTNVHVKYGRVATVIKREKKNENYNVVTPTLVAGVRGTSFLTSVENPNDSSSSGGIACDKENCLVKFQVMEGKIAVRHKESSEEVILEKNSELSVSGTRKFHSDLVRPLGKKSLDELKEMLVFHKSNIGGFENLADELKLTTRELQAFDSEGDLMSAKEKVQKKSISGKDEVRKKAEEINESKYLEKDISREKLKLPPKESF